MFMWGRLVSRVQDVFQLLNKGQVGGDIYFRESPSSFSEWNEGEVWAEINVSSRLPKVRFYV